MRTSTIGRQCSCRRQSRGRTLLHYYTTTTTTTITATATATSTATSTTTTTTTTAATTTTTTTTTTQVCVGSTDEFPWLNRAGIMPGSHLKRTPQGIWSRSSVRMLNICCSRCFDVLRQFGGWAAFDTSDSCSNPEKWLKASSDSGLRTHELRSAGMEVPHAAAYKQAEFCSNKVTKEKTHRDDSAQLQHQQWNSILPLPRRSEASGVESVWGEVSQESPKNR